MVGQVGLLCCSDSECVCVCMCAGEGQGGDMLLHSVCLPASPHVFWRRPNPEPTCTGSTTTATALWLSASNDCCVLMSTPDSQQPKPGWLWYQPTTISGLRMKK